MSLLKGVIIDVESAATKAVNAAVLQTELSQILENITACIDDAVASTDSAYESELLENLIRTLTTATKAAKMNSQIVLQLSQAALSSASDAVYTEDNQKILSEAKAAKLTPEEAQDEADFICDGSHPKEKSQHMRDRIKKNIIKKNKEKPPPHDKDCSNRWLADWTIHEYCGEISKSCTRCKIAIKHNQEKVADDA